MAILNQANYNPSLAQTERTLIAWATTGNTHTVTNAQVKANSMIFIHHTSDHAGRWWISAIADGSFTITSSDAETQTTTTFRYIIL